MSDTEAYEEVTVRSEGVTVTKRFEADEFPVPAIAFEFTTARDETVSVRLVDEVPDGVAVEDLGFHPEYGSEHWTIDEDTITFERDIEPDSEYITVYGIRATGTDDIEQFLTEPTIAEVDPPLPEGEEVSDDRIPESGDIVGDIISESDDDSSGTDEESADEEVETLSLTDPNAPEDDSSGESGAESAAEDIEAGKIVSAMATEIRNNDVSVDDLKLIKRAFDHVDDGTADGADETDDGTADGTTDARVQKLQSDVADLRAYTDALEEFLDENGTAEQLITEFEEQLDQFSDELEGIQSDLDDNTTTVEDLDESVDSLRESVDELESEVPEGDVMERLDDIQSDVDDLRDWQEQIKQTFGG